MLTLGVDLAAQDANTGVCLVRWEPHRATVLLAHRGASDDEILALAGEAAGGDAGAGGDAPTGRAGRPIGTRARRAGPQGGASGEVGAARGRVTRDGGQAAVGA